MIVYIFLFVLIIIAIFWFASFILQHVEIVTITWGTWGSYKISSTDLLIAFVVIFIVFYFFIWLVKFLVGIRKKFTNYRHACLIKKTRQDLIQGLIEFTSGHWTNAETLLLRNIAYAETPLLNYLAAARAAHMRGNYDSRDKYLKKAAEKGENNKIAIAVSQAEMQLNSQQVEQARATLVRLLELSPHHPYASQLLAKVYYQQEDWKNLFELLPELKKRNLLHAKVQKKYEATALKGIFQFTALKKQPKELLLLWRKLPATIKAKPPAILNYIDALIIAGDEPLAEKTLLNSLNKYWDASLIKRFGYINHTSLNKSIQQAENWLLEYDNSPELLFCLARLYRNNKLWGKSCYFYELGLNMMPNTKGYLEFAELLMQLNDKENAVICYQKGLEYCVTKQGEALHLKTKNPIKNT